LIAPVIEQRLCSGCGACIATCPDRVILPSPGAPLVSVEVCSGCWDCVEVCPTGAIREAGG
jgi:Pyruvate/2-oxoacid:ferredoxin oxidoreductase delta subunit